MGTGVAAAVAVEAEGGPPTPGPGLTPEDWARAALRLADYLGALGVEEPRTIERLTSEVRRRVAARADAAPLEDPVEAAIEEINAVLDLWLLAELGPECDTGTLFRARAAVLGGAVPDWTSRWAGLSDRPLGPAIRSAIHSAVPEESHLSMEDSTIELLFHRLGCRLASVVDRVLCRPCPRDPAGGGRL